MKYLLICLLGLPALTHAQTEVNDQSLRYQQQRMVYLQWDQNKFTPTKGFLGLNPYYWLVWGLFYPNYHKTDLRPLSASGPQTQRLALVAAQAGASAGSRAQADTLRNTALLKQAAEQGLLSDADPLWILYYRGQFEPLTTYSPEGILGPLGSQLAALVTSQGYFAWYAGRLAELSQRLQGTRTSDMDRGSRIMAYYRLLKELRALQGAWSEKVAFAARYQQLSQRRQQLSQGLVSPGATWTPQRDQQIAAQILSSRKY
jgi:hypothetical protein